MVDIIFEPSSTVESFSSHLQNLSVANGSIIILSCDANHFAAEVIDPVLKQCNAAIIGGIFPSIIYNNTKYDSGTLFIALKERMQVNIIESISHKAYDELDGDVENQIGDFDDSVKTMFVFIDSMSKNIGESINVLFDNYGLGINYIGGGCGSLSFEPKPSLFTNRGLLSDSCVYAYSIRQSSIGVTHGWKSISGPYQVTKSDKTVVQELDYKPAFEVYKQIVERYRGENIHEKNFYDIAKSFPFGLVLIRFLMYTLYAIRLFCKEQILYVWVMSKRGVMSIY